MYIRERLEKSEYNYLSEHAQLSILSKGRQRQEEKCSVRTEFQRDRDRILHCKSFRRLKHKTQVFISPEGDHYRTRLTHTLEVSQIARTISRALGLNEDLTEAISLGHDLGHTPFGHTGERILNDLSKSGFKHNIHSLRVVDVLENGCGLNLTFEVRDGIVNHTSSGLPATLEGQVVSISDRIAYINHDIDDAIRAKILSLEDLPKDCVSLLGDNHNKRINTMVVDVIKNSMDKSIITMSEEIGEVSRKLRDFMFERVYIDSIAKSDDSKAANIIEALYRYFLKHLDELPLEYCNNISVYGEDQCVCDYIAGMTDRYAINKFQELFIPSSWNQI